MSRPARAIHVEGDWLRVPATALDLAGFRAWVTSPEFPESSRATFVDDEVFVEMSPESLESHNKAKVEITAVLQQIVRDEALGEVYADGMLLTHPGAGVSTEPDLIFASWARFDDSRVRLVEKAGRADEYIEIVGAPDLVVEIVSDSSVRKDLVLLRGAYCRAGIPEYWTVDARSSDVRFEILVLDGGAYRSAAPAGVPQPSSVLSRAFSLVRARNRAGRWAYRLDVV